MKFPFIFLRSYKKGVVLNLQGCKTHKKSKLTLTVNCLEESTKNFELIRIHVDFYFIYDSETLDLKDIFFKKNLICFYLI
jgi:hypothetical protein